MNYLDLLTRTTDMRTGLPSINRLCIALGLFSIFTQACLGQTFFGTTHTGGPTGGGTIFRVNADGSGFATDYNFQIDNNPGRGAGSANMIKLTNGKLYGVMSAGGKTDRGILFEYDPSTLIYSKKIDFDDYLITGWNPMGALVFANGKLYGTSSQGGASNDGTIFEYDPVSNVLAKQTDFEKLTTGSQSQGAMTLASNGKLYGVTPQGGQNDAGVLFEYDITLKTLTKKIDFVSATQGSNPLCKLTEFSNKLYGMTVTGGANNYGVIFEYDLTSGILVKKVDFDGTNIGNGGLPLGRGGLFLASNNKFYGSNFLGGANGNGIFFEYSPGATTVTKRKDFDGLNFGSFAGSELVQHTPNGKIYGTTQSGGVNDAGVLFEYDPSTDTFTKKIDFDRIPSGSAPAGLTKADNGSIYCTAGGGGLFDSGVLFSYTPGNTTITKHKDLNQSLNGSFPNNSLVAATNGRLYGMTPDGGTLGQGVIFEYEPISKAFIKKFDFSNATSTGANPLGNLTLANNGKLYGMTNNGGANGGGVLFEYDFLNNIFANKIDLDYPTGSSPNGGLTLASNGKFYGLTSQGGTGGYGVLFEYDLSSNIYSKKIDFAFTNGFSPNANLIQSSNGKLYGTTAGGGASSNGTLFEYDLSLNVLNKIVDFDDTSTGSQPQGNLVQAPNGKLYGMTTRGGLNGDGVLFELNPTTNQFIKKIDFNASASFPIASLSVGIGGKLLGLTNGGGSKGYGALFEYDPATNTMEVMEDFVGTNGASPGAGAMASITFPLPQITNESFVSTYNNGSTVTVSITVDNVSLVESVKFISKGISEADSGLKSVLVVGNGTKFEKIVAVSELTDPIGLQYYFEITSIGQVKVSSNKGKAYVKYKTSEQSIPGLTFGDQVSNYSIIAVPLEMTNKTVTTVFSALGAYDKTKWRLFDYTSSDNREYPGFSTIDIGKGYWLIARNSVTINPGEGSTPTVDDTAPFTINLSTGWNLIGNPYNFRISWTEVLTASSNPAGVGTQLKLFSSGTLTDGTVLDKYRGAFVFSSAAAVIKIPATRNTSLGGRIKSERGLMNGLDQNHWEVKLKLSEGTLSNELGGIGMHPAATLKGKDPFDEVSVPLPEGLNLFELAYPHPEVFTDFNKEVVPTQENFTWNFDVKRSSKTDNLELTWANDYFGDNEKQLMLFDPSSLQVVDMKMVSHFTLTSRADKLRILYGGKEYIQHALDKELPWLGNPYPNPAKEELTIPFRVPESQDQMVVQIKIYNSLGAEVGMPVNGILAKGNYKITWQPQGETGLFIVRMKIGQQETKATKVIIN